MTDHSDPGKCERCEAPLQESPEDYNRKHREWEREWEKRVRLTATEEAGKEGAG
jgi:hypothetical protein